MGGLKGVQEAIKQIRQLAQKAQKAKQVAELRVAERMAADARANAPVDKGLLQAGIGTVQNEISTKVVSEAGYSAYEEFGTGPLVSIPKGLEAYAKEFFVNGEGNTPAQPFFFPAVFKHKDTVITEVEKELEKISK